MRFTAAFLLAALGWGRAHGQTLNCDLREYRPAAGIKAESAAGGLRVTAAPGTTAPVESVTIP